MLSSIRMVPSAVGPHVRVASHSFLTVLVFSSLFASKSYGRTLRLNIPLWLLQTCSERPKLRVVTLLLPSASLTSQRWAQPSIGPSLWNAFIPVPPVATHLVPWLSWSNFTSSTGARRLGVRYWKMFNCHFLTAAQPGVGKAILKRYLRIKSHKLIQFTRLLMILHFYIKFK